VGTRVSITRHDHGWLDGSEAGTVIYRHQRSGGSWGYVVRTDGGDHPDLTINHTRDIRPIG
jgi:hypothetical protein